MGCEEIEYASQLTTIYYPPCPGSPPIGDDEVSSIFSTWSAASSTASLTLVKTTTAVASYTVGPKVVVLEKVCPHKTIFEVHTVWVSPMSMSHGFAHETASMFRRMTIDNWPHSMIIIVMALYQTLNLIFLIAVPGALNADDRLRWL